MKPLLVTLMLCSLASAKERPAPAYQNAIFQETHAEPVRVNCYGSGYGSSMTPCHDGVMLVYAVKAGQTILTLTPYGTRPHQESLWRQAPGSTVSIWNDGKHVHVRSGAKVSAYDTLETSVEDASR